MSRRKKILATVAYSAMCAFPVVMFVLYLLEP